MQTHRILVVDDDPKVRKIIFDRLSEGGYEPVTAASGTEAMAALQGETPAIAVAVIDLILDGVSGLEVMKGIKAASPDTECIILTGHASQETAIEAMNLGAYSYIQKSYEMESLLLTIRRACDQRSARLALRESEENYRSLASTADLMYLVDRDCRFLFMNEGYRARRGVALEDIIGKTYGDFHTKRETKRFCLKVARIFKTGKPIQHESYGKDGECFLKTLSPVKDQSGGIRAVTTVSKDISSLKRVEEALQESETLYRSVFEGTSTAIGIVEEDTTISMVNTAFEKLSGYSKEEVEGRMSWANFVAPEEMDRIQGYHEQRRKNEEGVPREYEFRFVDKEGNTKTIYTMAGMIPGTTRSVCSLVDITSIKRAEAAMRKSEERYRALFDHNPIETIIVDREAKVTGYNLAKKVSGHRLPTIDRDVMYRDYAAKHTINMFEELKECIKSGISKEFPEKEYGEHFLDIKIAPFSEGAIITTIDVTQRKQAEAERKDLESQLQEAQKMKAIGTLAGGLAHDFNNLLMAILGNADLAVLDLSGESPVRSCIEEIEKAARRAAELTRQMLAYSGRGRFVVKSIDLSQTVKEMTQLLRASTSKAITLNLDLQPGLPPIRADAAQVQQVVMNLVTNASEAIDEGQTGIVSISTGILHCTREDLDRAYLKEPLAEGRYVYLEVADTGRGMDKETQSKIFDPFFSTKFTGRGLGLAAVLGIVRSHRGAILVEGEPESGSLFRVLFPPTRERAEKPNESRDSETAAARQAAGVILLVDDEESVRALGIRMLERSGFRVLTAEDGVEALAVFRRHADTIRGVILDLTMPRMSGQECFHHLRRIKPDLPILLSSGFDEQEATARFTGQKHFGFIQKPYKTALLAKKLRQVLGESTQSEAP